MPIESTRGRGATRNATPTRFNLKEKLVEGDWLDSVEALDGVLSRIRKFDGVSQSETSLLLSTRKSGV